MRNEQQKQFMEEDVSKLVKHGLVFVAGDLHIIEKVEQVGKQYKKFKLTAFANQGYVEFDEDRPRKHFLGKEVTLLIGNKYKYLSPEDDDFNKRILLWESLREIKNNYIAGIIKSKPEKYKRMKQVLESYYETVNVERHRHAIQAYDMVNGRR